MIKSAMPYLLQGLSSNKILRARRTLYSFKRRVLAKAPEISVFLKADDPYSYLLVQALASFGPRFDATLRFYVFLDVDPAMYPKLSMWEKYARHDAHQLAGLYGLDFPNNDQLAHHDQNEREKLAQRLVGIEGEKDFLLQAKKLLSHYWSGEPLENPRAADVDRSALRLLDNQIRLRKKGHYMGAMLNFEGEWYWGIDRLDHLERRLIDAGLCATQEASPQFILTYASAKRTRLPTAHQPNPPLVLYWSARSPYSYLGLERAVLLCERAKLPLVIKPVLPMMMRNIAVPNTKKMYIFFDTKREAQKFGIPYGRVADPLGAAVERCYALLRYADSKNKRCEFLLSFARGVNAEGIRADTDSGLAKIVRRCGLDWDLAKEQLLDESWRQDVQHNLEEMLELGCWGVPSFRYGTKHFWGQDRIGLIEHEINTARHTER